ncbi:MAG: CHASE2 domain-containing protein [Gloeocapsa sp. UFS-A4-WI-NPMV-4B04]|nr:CHASE2 domain-containing protein [Gloeocapsa sp. UFS-A4-WI-NPMV-4B04]
MGKLVVFKLGDGNFEQGFSVTLQIGEDGDRPSIEITGKLPPAPEIPQHYSCWQSAYRRLGLRSRLEAEAVQVTNVCVIQDCCHAVEVLCNSLNTWLHSQSFRPLRERFLERLMPSDEVRVIIQAEDIRVQRLPWHLCDLFERYSHTEIALSTPAYESVKQVSIAKNQVKILAILGNSDGIDTQADAALLERLPNAQVKFLVEPQRQELTNQLWLEGWDILFFAGHSTSSVNGETGRIYINQTDSLTINDLRYALQTAVEHGLKLAIFNSCDGLGLARNLANLQIPQIVVMREPVPDRVAHQFLKHFLQAFARGTSFYLAVREARERLQSLEDQFPCATWLPIIYQNPAEVPPTWKQLCSGIEEDGDRHLQRQKLRTRDIFRKAFFVSAVITSFVVGVRHVGVLQQLELQAFDHLNQLRPIEGPDPRLLVVTINEADIQAQSQESGQGSLSERSLLRLLEKLQRYQPRTVGLDIYRPLPVEPNYPYLKTRLEQNNSLIGVCKVSDPEVDELGVAPPPEIPKQRLGFSDAIADGDNNTVRRQLLHLTPPLASRCGTKYAFSLQLALHYLDTKGIAAKVTPEGYLQFGDVVFKQLKSHTGGYQNVDDRGYQLLLNYRPFHSLEDIAAQISLKDILNEQISPDLVKELKNRIVIIGVTAPSASDYWFTPYTTGQQAFQKQIPGVFLQAQMVSQILSAVLDKRPLLWVWDQWSEGLWIWGWSIVGGILALRLRSLLHLELAIVLALATLYGLCFLILTQGGWVPLVPSALVLIATGGSVAVYKYVHFYNTSKPLNSKPPLG